MAGHTAAHADRAPAHQRPGPCASRCPRADYDPGTVRAVLDAGLIAHVGVATADGPIVLPMAYGVGEDTLYLHGATGNAMLQEGSGREVCVTVTLLDALVVARTPFHHSMDYRCVVVRGTARAVTDEAERIAALHLVTDHVVATWDHCRPPSAAELRRTRVVAVPLTEASAKVRSGGPADEPDDVAGPHWAGHVPISSRFEAPVPSADLTGDPQPPPAVAALTGRRSPGVA